MSQNPEHDPKTNCFVNEKNRDLLLRVIKDGKAKVRKAGIGNENNVKFTDEINALEILNEKCKAEFKAIFLTEMTSFMEDRNEIEKRTLEMRSARGTLDLVGGGGKAPRKPHRNTKKSKRRFRKTINKKRTKK